MGHYRLGDSKLAKLGPYMRTRCRIILGICVAEFIPIHCILRIWDPKNISAQQCIIFDIVE